MSTILITGANRGLGLEFASQYVRAGWRVFATCRDPRAADELNAVARSSSGAVTVHRLDVTDSEQVSSLSEELASEPIDALLNNAGVSDNRYRSFGSVDYATWEETLRVNTIGPMRMAEAFVEHVAGSDRKLLVCVSSRMGSITANTDGGAYVYRSSKAALNAVVRSLAADLAERNITVVAVHPGWVKTDMGGAGAPLAPAESVRSLRTVIDGLTPAASGTFLNYDGTEIPW